MKNARFACREDLDAGRAFGVCDWWVVLARVRGELPDRSAGDAGMVPLTSRETAKGGEQRTQLASLKQVSAVLQRSHPRAKRKPAPRIMHSCPEAHHWGMVGSQIMVAIMENNLLVEPEEVCYNGGS